MNMVIFCSVKISRISIRETNIYQIYMPKIDEGIGTHEIYEPQLYLQLQLMNYNWW